MGISLKGMSEKELRKLRADVDKALEKLVSDKLDEARKAAEAAAKKFGFDLGQLVGQPAAKAKRTVRKAAAAAKYANPADKSQTWSGRGRQPAWFKAALAKGTSPDDLKV